MGGLLLGRTPEYLGKTVSTLETKFIALYMLIGPMTILFLTAVAVVTSAGLAGLTTNSGPHGFTEILFGYTSSFANNGQNFAGQSANTIFYNLTTAVAIWIGRFVLAIRALSLAGQFAAQGRRQLSLGTLPTDSALFAGMTIGVVLIIGALGSLPALAMGPIVEHLMLGK